MNKITPAPTNKAVHELFLRSGSDNKADSAQALDMLAVALTEPLRQAVLHGANLEPIFTPVPLAEGSAPEFSIDVLTPGQEDEHIAYTNPGNGRIPERHIEGDYVTIPTYGIASSVDWALKHARASRFDVMSRAMQILEAGFVRKLNTDGWHTVLSAGTDRNILVHDADANAGQFTKRLVSLAQTVMQRNAGGNHSSLNPGRLTDIFMSLEGIQDIRNWGVDQVDDFTRRDIFLAPNGNIVSIYGVSIHGMYEFGVDQEYQKYFTNQLSGTMGASDNEVAVACDLSTNDSFMMPMTVPVSIFQDDALHRHQRAGFYGWAEVGFGVLDNRRVLMLSF